MLAVDVVWFIHTTLIIKLNLTFEEKRTRKELEKEKKTVQRIKKVNITKVNKS